MRRGNDIVVEQRVAIGRPVQWPQDAAPLAPDTTYQLELLLAGTDRPSIAIGLRTAGPSATSEALTLISAE